MSAGAPRPDVLRAWAALLSGRAARAGAGEVLFAFSVLGLVVLLVTPLGPGALDLLVPLDLAAAAVILAVALFAREPLRFSAFPTLLLLTTLLRVALNVGSTRLILSRGQAGRVIEAFGRVVVQGDLVTGAVVFAILTLVQLLVVAKGAERVAEVAARFTLDALPGKQMSIDADVRGGLLDAGEARRRRRALERESQLYGAMDGALKFVKGDAIAGVAIVLVNVVGGLATGILRGMSAAEAGRRYAILAIGDGLSSQLASLLVAIAAGVAVTRVSAEDEEAALSAQIRRQLAGQPAALLAVVLLFLGLALAPGLPAAPLLSAAALLAVVAAFGAWRRLPAPVEARAGAGASGPDDPLAPFAPAVPVALELAPDLHALAAGGELAGRGIASLRADLWHSLGVKLPALAVRRGGDLAHSGFRLRIDEIPVHQGRAPVDELLVLASPDDLALVGIAARRAADPVSGRPVGLVAGAHRARAAALGRVCEPLERVLVEVAGALRHNAHLLLGVQEVQCLLDDLEPQAPALVREVSRQVPATLLAEVLRRLVEEGVSIRPFRAILEAVLQAGAGTQPAAPLAEACRRALRRQLGHAHAGDGPLPVLLLDPAAEQAIRDALAGEMLALDPARALAFLDALAAELRGHTLPPVVLVSPDVRRAVRLLVASRFPRLSVLAYEELPPELRLRPVGRIGVPC